MYSLPPSSDVEILKYPALLPPSHSICASSLEASPGPNLIPLPVAFKFKKLVDGLYFITLSVFSALLPEDESTNVINLDALVLASSLIATKDAAPAAKLPELTHLVSVPSDERTWPLLPNELSPSLSWPSNLTVFENLATSLNVLSPVHSDHH